MRQGSASLRFLMLVPALWLATRLPSVVAEVRQLMGVRPAHSTRIIAPAPANPTARTEPESLQPPAAASPGASPPGARQAAAGNAISPRPIHAAMGITAEPPSVQAEEREAQRPAPDYPASPPAPGELATEAYRLLRSGDRRGAARQLSAALADGSDDRAPQWRTDLHRIASHWHGDAWLFRRNVSGGSIRALGIGAPSLGGSQIGGRIDYLPSPLAMRPLLIGARFARPLSAPGGANATQLAAGIGLRPVPGIPVRISAERLIGTGGGTRDAWGVRIEGGGTIALPHGFRLDGYGQAGIIGARGRDGFADGAAVLARPVSKQLSLRAGAWGSIQPGARRLDAGPGIAAHARIAGTDLTAALDWRLRLAGNAKPVSGPAVMLAAGF